jgi:Tfp pilus assembly protein FimT
MGRALMRAGVPGRGFTIIELMVTAVVIIILTLGAVSGLRSLQTQRQLQGLAQSLVADLNLARTSALGTTQSVIVTTAANGQGYRLLRCNPVADCSTATDTVKAVDLPPSVSVTAARSFEFVAPKAMLASASQSACLRAAGSTTVLKVGVDNAVGKVTICSVGTAASGFAACSAGC